MYPQVVMTSDNASILHREFLLLDNEELFDASEFDNQSKFDTFGNYQKGTTVASPEFLLTILSYMTWSNAMSF